MDSNLEEGQDVEQIKDAFSEFYKLFDDFGIIGKQQSYANIRGILFQRGTDRKSVREMIKFFFIIIFLKLISPMLYLRMTKFSMGKS